MLVLGGGPDWCLMCWNWNKAKLIASSSVSVSTTPMYKCSFSPLDSSVAVVLGKESVKFYRIGEKDMRILHDSHMPGCNFISSCWMRTPDDHLLVGTDEGRILLFRSGEFLTEIVCAPAHIKQSDLAKSLPKIALLNVYPISSLVSISGGFIAGSACGTLFIYHYDDTRDQVLYDEQFSVLNILSASDLTSGILQCIALCPKDEKLSAITSDGQLITISVVKKESIKADNFKYLSTPFHGPQQITGMDVAIRKPLILTCSKDGSLKLWNIKTHQMDLSKIFTEEMFRSVLLLLVLLLILL